AIRRGLRFGPHGLPLIGCGDWNDGMNLVGAGGRGESVWLAFFLYDVLTQFAGLAGRRGDEAFAATCRNEAQSLRENIERHAWDGQWYRRAYFDDGTPLGSAANPECQIDSLPQSWAVLSGAGDPARAQMALDAVAHRLVRRDAGIVQLFTPPFDKSALEPGYIKGYVPGVRENGGQYTHAAIWTIMAFAAAGDTARAWDLFRLIHPVWKAGAPDGAKCYKVEPYVVAADVYSLEPHTGRGGWTWYTGSAGWMYRLVVETFLGLHLDGGRLRFSPKAPRDWKRFKIHYRHRETLHHITLINTRNTWEGPQRIVSDGVPQPEAVVPLHDDRQVHHVEIRFGER
ncbi:MAG: GH36-type glycosyl hydrolase domain-containing protein, partial [Opitutaceae bacterium]